MRKAEHYLVVRNDRLGDTMLALPVVASLKAAYPKARISLLTSPITAPLMETVEGVESVLAAHDSNCQDVLPELHKGDFTTAICLRPTFSNAWTLAKSRIPVRIGTSRRAYSILFTKRVSVSRSGSVEHEADLNLRMLEPLGIVPKTTFPCFNLPVEALADADALLSEMEPGTKLAILHPGSGGSARNWPVEYFNDLAAQLAASGVLVAISGSKSETELCSRVAGKGMINLAGKTDLVTLAAVIERASVLVAGSTGPLHLAVALARPVVGLYPPIKDNMPSRWGPYLHPEWAMMPDLPLCKGCRPGQYSNCSCMEQITVESVFRKTLRILSNDVNFSG